MCSKSMKIERKTQTAQNKEIHRKILVFCSRQMSLYKSWTLYFLTCCDAGRHTLKPVEYLSNIVIRKQRILARELFTNSDAPKSCMHNTYQIHQPVSYLFPLIFLFNSHRSMATYMEWKWRDARSTSTEIIIIIHFIAQYLNLYTALNCILECIRA